MDEPDCRLVPTNPALKDNPVVQAWLDECAALIAESPELAELRLTYVRGQSLDDARANTERINRPSPAAGTGPAA